MENQAWYCETARHLAKHLNCTVMATGKKDLIADAESAFLVSNGHAALSGVTGTGCMVGALTAAYLPGSKAIFTKSGIFETSSLIPDKTKVSYGTAAALLRLSQWEFPESLQQRFQKVQEASRQHFWMRSMP